MDINLPQSEKKTLFRFLALYIFFTVVILALTTFLYYSLQKELYNQQKTIALNQYANDFLSQLKEIPNQQSYPKDDNFETSLYDKNYNLIYSTQTNPKKQLGDIEYNNDVIVRYIKEPNKYFKHTQYLIVQINDNSNWKDEVFWHIIIYGVLFFIFMVMIGYFLLNLFLKPMKDMLRLLNQFIKDTTHELNTPISTIRTNIELIDQNNIEDTKLKKIIGRIDIGAKTISNIYDDLTYLILHHKIKSHDQTIHLDTIIDERIEYFRILANSKKVIFYTDTQNELSLFMDRNKLIKLLDNIISNAIKYNKRNGKIFITLKGSALIIKDTGKGIKKEYLNSLFDRYARFDNVVGGFGIGLNIVKMICDEYHIKISIDSKVDEYTEVTLSFKG